MNKQISFQDIIDSDFCSASGACVKACPNQNYRMIFNDKKGFYEPQKINKDIPDDPIILEVCPSYKMDYDELGEFVFGSKPDTELGHIQQCYLAQSLDYDRNYKATSGGIIKETLIYLFREKKIDSAIVIKRIQGLEYKPVKITSAEEVDSLPPSVYHSIDYTSTITLLEEASPDEKVAVVAVPCQLDGLYKFIQKCKPELKSRIYITIGLLTGWYFTFHTIKALCAYYKINFNDLDDIQYRGGGPKGKTRFIFKDGSKKEVPRITLRSIVAFERYFNVPRFNVDVNTHNVLADMVVGDTHVPEYSYSKTGISLVIARSPKADSILQEMENKKIIRMQKTENDHIVKSQKRERIFGDFAFAYADYLRSIGEYAPEFKGINKEYTRPVSRERLEKFHKNFKSRVKLQRQGKYWQILIMKYTFEFIPVFKRLGRQVIGKIKAKIMPDSSKDSSKADKFFV
jgi:coenzyme F420-reducing hydrogenase beta subunit